MCVSFCVFVSMVIELACRDFRGRRGAHIVSHLEGTRPTIIDSSLPISGRLFALQSDDMETVKYCLTDYESTFCALGQYFELPKDDVLHGLTE